MADDRNLEAQMDAKALYQEEVFTDRRVGAIRRLTPVTPEGQPDTARPTLFLGQAEIMTNMGPVPINFVPTQPACLTTRCDEAVHKAVEQRRVRPVDRGNGPSFDPAQTSTPARRQRHHVAAASIGRVMCRQVRCRSPGRPGSGLIWSSLPAVSRPRHAR